MNTRAPLTGRPPRAVTFTRAVIGVVLLVTGFGREQHLGDDEPVARCLQLTDVDDAPVGFGVPTDHAGRIRDRGRRAAVVARDDANADRAARRRRRGPRTSVSVAPWISLQLSPFVLQRSQTYE